MTNSNLFRKEFVSHLHLHICILSLLLRAIGQELIQGDNLEIGADGVTGHGEMLLTSFWPDSSCAKLI